MVAYKCLSQNPKSRPTMREVVQALEPILSMDDYLQIGPFVFTIIVEDISEGKGKMVDGEKVNMRVKTTVEEEKHQSHQELHRQKFPNSAVHAEVLHRDGDLRPHISALQQHRRTASYVGERGA